MRKFIINVNGKSYEVDVEEIKNGTTYNPPVAKAAPVPVSAPAAPAPAADAAEVPAGAENVTAPMPGNIWKVNVSVGDTVQEGQVLVVLEAMKMENDILAPKAGKVAAVHVEKGASVETGTVLVSIS